MSGNLIAGIIIAIILGLAIFKIISDKKKSTTPKCSTCTSRTCGIKPINIEEKK